MIAVSFTIYILAGIDIYKKGGQLRFFKHQNFEDMVMPADPFTNTKTTDIEISTELTHFPNAHGPPSSLSKSRTTDGSSLPTAGYEPYTVRIERGPTNHQQQQMPSAPSTSSVPHQPANGNGVLEANAAAKAYTKCAMLFFLSLLITWVSSLASLLPHLPDNSNMHSIPNYRSSLKFHRSPPPSTESTRTFTDKVPPTLLSTLPT